jgi:uncharacterized integral membrane protein
MGGSHRETRTSRRLGQPRDGEGGDVSAADSPQAVPVMEPVEPFGERVRRHGHRIGLYAWAFAGVALLVVLIALAIANTDSVRLSWVVGEGRASLVWIILASAVLGWLLGMLTSVVFRLRTRRRRPPAGLSAPSDG